MFDNSGTKMGTEMLDTQFATKMTGLRGGLSEAIARQLERQMSATPAQALMPAAAAGAPARSESAVKGTPRQAAFLKDHQDAARAAEAQTGIPATFMVAQAAHETGWGKHEIRHADGSPSFNLFGIKADANWKGPVAEVSTTEYVSGVARKVVAKFRAYASYAESFGDYAKLMKSSPRYANVVANADSASSIPDFIAACVPLMREALRKPASSPTNAPPGNVSFGSDCRPPAAIARAPYEMRRPPSKNPRIAGCVL